MSDNLRYLEKGDLRETDLVTNGGILVDARAREFMELLIKESTLLKMVTSRPMTAQTMEIPKFGFTGRVLHSATEAVPLPEALRAKPETGKVTLSTQEYIATARVSYNVVEDNIIAGAFIPFMMGLLSKAVSRDIEFFGIMGDTTSADTDLNKQDGWLKRQTSRVISAGGVRLHKGPLKQAVQTMPSEYLTDRMVFITSKNAKIDYSDSLANRQTAKGDQQLDAKPGQPTSATYDGYPVIMSGLWPETLGGDANMTAVTFCDPKNMVVGIARNIRVESTRNIESREFVIVVTLRMGFQWIHEPATVKITNILAEPGV